MHDFFIIIPPQVVFNEELNFTEKALYGVIYGLSQRNGYCFASNEYLANVISLDIRSLQRYLANLEKVNLITREKDEKGKRHIRIAYLPQEGVTKMPGVS